MPERNYEQLSTFFVKDNKEDMDLYESVMAYCGKAKIGVSVYIKKLLIRDSIRRD
ncbi:MAG: hypothetical protein WC619_02020 [Patescibacteria group bacterium]